jgi:hypothetical protein
MSGGARRAHERIDVNRPVELAELDEYGAVVGYTQNLSEDGVRARFDVTPAPAANVLVRLFLEDGADPIEKRGRVVWSAPDIYGDGTEVGLHLIEEEDVAAGQAPEGRIPVLPEQALCVGQPVQVSRAGVAYDAVIAEIGEPDGAGKISVVLSTAAEIETADQPAIEQPQEADDTLDVEQWKPHPFRDAWNTVRRLVGPPARVLARVAVALAAVGARFFKWAWGKLPAQPRASAESFFKRAGRSLGGLRARLGEVTSLRAFRRRTSKEE